MSPTRSLAIALGAASLLLGATFAQAAPPSDDDNHAMGSQIAIHEGGGTGDPGQPDIRAAASVPGMDVSSYQGNVNWQKAWNDGARFAYVKATESTTYTNPDFAQQYNGSYGVGMIRGAYHFARPDKSGGAAQANYFLAHGGGWSADGKTLPGALDMEYAPSGDKCYGLSKTAMANWIRDFSDTYHARTKKYPAIYTSTSWWGLCVGQHDFSSTNPLWVARYASTVGALPYNWKVHTFWQHASSGKFPGDQDLFNGSYDRLQALAKNHDLR
ncbi:GH25 family lysozyme M1 (1,4-beta-N-acetylmuramidase) [Nocardia pseudobrasiliensis]|uniref:Lysozyme n=2 Tax=Nocardia pseudobrasiliensis TaxID=45979 RepID=A0A370HP05_9NOCA|nr:GH25 family lysozyme M1 (1,4-beta-N-acetylmuramidase) [Nocardia pseudobrasiliensis]